MKEWLRADPEEQERDKLEQGAIAFDKHTEWLIEQKEQRAQHIVDIGSRSKITFHPIRMGVFMNVVRKVAKKYQILGVIPTHKFSHVNLFLDAVIKAFESSGVSQDDIKWIKDTYNEMASDRVNK